MVDILTQNKKKIKLHNLETTVFCISKVRPGLNLKK